MPVPKQENSMLCDVQYVKANKQNGTPDYLYLIWRDLDTQEKHLQIIPEPKMSIYFEKPELRGHKYNKNYARIEDLYEKTVKATRVIQAIAEDGGEATLRFLNNAYATKNYNAIQSMYLYPYVFGADYDVASWYRIQWVRRLNNDRPKLLHKGFLDIEVDGIEVPGMPNPEDCPVNAVTLIDDWDKVCYTFLLVNRECTDPEKRPLYEHMWSEQRWMMDHPQEVVQRCHDMFDES